MIREFMDIIWHDNINPRMRIVDLSDLKNFHVVACYIIGQLEWRHIDDIDIRVFNCKYSGNLSVFSLEELFHGNTLELMHGIRIYVDLNALFFLNILPLLLELFLHLPPKIEVLVVDLLDASLSLLLEEEQPESSLYDLRFLHEELELAVSGESLVHSPILLNSDGRKFGTPGALEHARWNFNDFTHIIFVGNAVIELHVRWLSHIRGLGL